MHRWYVEEHKGRVREGGVRVFERLGVVTAEHQPDAMLKALKKFKITTQDRQLKIRVTRTKRPL